MPAVCRLDNLHSEIRLAGVALDAPDEAFLPWRRTMRRGGNRSRRKNCFPRNHFLLRLRHAPENLRDLHRALRDCGM